MITCVIKPRTSTRWLICLALAASLLSSAAYAAGHTIRNGGGDEELAFIDTWNAFDHQLAACANQLGPCQLSETERKALTELLMFKRNCFPAVRVKPLSGNALSIGACGETLTVNASALYDGDAVKNTAGMLTVVLDVLRQQSCSARLLASLDTAKIAQAAAEIRYFSMLAEGEQVYVLQSLSRGASQTLTVALNEKTLDLVGLLRSRYTRLMGPLKFSLSSRALTADKLEISGEVQPQGGAQTSFFISLDKDLNSATAFIYME